MRENKEISERPAANKKVRALIIAVLAIILVCSGVFLALHFEGVLSAESDEKRLTTAPHSESDSQLAENTVDFESLQAGNSEIYAWITVPGTEVATPSAKAARTMNTTCATALRTASGARPAPSLPKA